MSINGFIDVNKENMIKDLMEFVNIPTVLSDYGEDRDHPFGIEVGRGLEWILDKAESFGFKCRNVDGYAGEITVGSGHNIIGILGHEDVVSADDGWDTEPFEAVLREDKIIGRGSSDDKGPLISCLYVMKYLKDNNLIPEDKSIRMIIGTDEEVEWRCIDYYKAHTDILPDYSIVPDGNFPLIFCEKGLIDFNMTADIMPNNDADIVVNKLHGGSGRNIVAGKAECTLYCCSEITESISDILSENECISTENSDEGLIVRVTGKGTHAMSPEKGKNAICILLDALGKLPYETSIDDFIETFNKYIGMDYNAEKFVCDFQDELSGRTTLNIGIINMTEKQIVMEANMRYPASCDWDDVKAALLKTTDEADFKYTKISYLPPVYVDPESRFVNVLLNAYRENTHDYDSKPISIGGATYARAIPNAVSFGPLFPYEEELAHEPNEYLSVKSFEKMTVIFSDALEALMSMEDL